MIARQDLIGLGVGLAASFALTGCIYLIHNNISDEIELPTASSKDGVISAEEWAEVFPNEYKTWAANAENSDHYSYLEEDTYLTTIYDGYGFAIDYESARGHSYGLEDVNATKRPHAKANCLTCKTPNFTKLVNDEGKEVYARDFEEVNAQMDQTQSVACYTCHENQEASANNLVVTHDYTIERLGDAVTDGSIPAATLACGQCHIEYYFDPDTSATTTAWTSVEEMTPEYIISYYNDMNFSDWTQEDTGTGMIKAQHPEFETILTGPHASISCAQCHMEKQTDEDGNTYTSHKFISPLESDSILQTCSTCHGDTDMKQAVKDVQEEVTAKEDEVGFKLADLKNALAAAVSAGEMSQEQLDEVRQIYREAQFYFDFDYVENSEGAHNHSLAAKCLETADEMADEALSKLEA